MGIGEGALNSLTAGDSNVAVGYAALSSTTTGIRNVAIGSEALLSNISGGSNVGIGFGALYPNTTGGYNVAVGANALFQQTTGSSNIALGYGALITNHTGSNNVAIGVSAGAGLQTGSDNIYISPGSSTIAAAEANTIRIGTAGTQTATFIAGIRGVTTGVANGIAVLIDSNGQLGTVSSSRRFKTDIHDMADASNKLMQLRTVTFRYKPELDPSGTRQYGLIAEEVEKVMPDLVAYDKDGKIETVKYHLLAALLLNEVQKQAGQITAQERTMKAQAQQIETLTARLVQIEATVSAQGHTPPLEASYKGRSGL